MTRFRKDLFTSPAEMMIGDRMVSGTVSVRSDEAHHGVKWAFQYEMKSRPYERGTIVRSGFSSIEDAKKDMKHKGVEGVEA